MKWPEGKTFAFTVFDDTDRAYLENVREVYAFLDERGFRTTKSVWPVRGKRKPVNGGATCEEREYAKWVLSLKDAGFEIGLHNVTFHSSTRSETITGLEKFHELFHEYPRSMANHVGCREGIYWGDARLTGINRLIYNLLTGFRRHGAFRGHIGSSRYFWGDICRDRITYVRNFVFPDINTLKTCPLMPYHDPQRPFVNYWFAASEGSAARSFIDRISEKNQDRLEEEGGASIMYTHFGVGFWKDGSIDPRFRKLMERLSRKNGWFVPVSTLLDYLLEHKGSHMITSAERRRLERKWLLYKIRTGTT